MEYKVMIFDADGMVINKPYLFSEKLAEKQGIPLSKVTKFFENEFVACKIGKTDLKEELRKYLSEWEWKGSVEGLIKFWHESEDFVDEEVIMVIRKLKEQRVYCCLATDQDKYRTDYIRREMGLEKIFDDIFSSADLGVLKTQEEFYEKVFDRLRKDLPDLKKEEVLFWDHEEEKLNAAKSFGFQVKKYNSISSLQT